MEFHPFVNLRKDPHRGRTRVYGAMRTLINPARSARDSLVDSSSGMGFSFQHGRVNESEEAFF
jgi:hypothetical protein